MAAQPFGADLRSLAALRMALAGAVLIDLAMRARDLGAHYTDAGVLRRADVLESFGFLHAWPLCLHLSGGSWASQALLFALAGGFAACLFVGYRTTLSSVAVWLLTASLQLRNLYVGAGADAQLRMFLFWGIFLPLGARWSVDAAARRSPGGSQPNQHLSVSTVAILAQLVIMYLAAAYAKALEPEWRDGTAVAHVFDNELWGTVSGGLLQQAPRLCTALTYFVLGLEFAAPFLLVCPVAFGPVRTLTVAALACMHLGFNLGMRVSIFPMVSIAALSGFLPGWLWDRVEPRLAGVGAAFRQGVIARFPPPAAPTAAGALARVRPALREGACAVFLLHLLVWNSGVFRDRNYTDPEPVAWLGAAFFQQQDWRMFARVATRTGRVVVPGRLIDGTEIDLFSAGGPLPDLPVAGPARGPDFERPERLVYRVRNDRWLALVDRMVHGKRGDQALLHYARYLCRGWNMRHSGSRQLDTLEIVFMSRAVRAEYRPSVDTDYQQQVLWSHGCFR